MTASLAIAEASPKPIIRNRQLTIEELKTINFPMQIQEDTVIIDRSPIGCKLQHSIALNLEKVLAARTTGLIVYIFNALTPERPALIPFVFDNQSLLKMANHFLRHCSGSLHSCCLYVVNMFKYSAWLGYSPDLIIQDLRPVGSIPDPLRVQNHSGYLSDYLADLQDEGLKPGAVSNYIKSVKTFYRVNGIKIDLPEPICRRVTYRDRAPKPEELVKLLKIAGLRENLILSALTLGGFREGTLSKLKYRHVRRDLESNLLPIHIHVEREITKGKYGDYDTFLGAEAAEYLKLYIDQRRKGNQAGKGRHTKYMPPEELTDDSPLIRDEKTNKVKGISPKQIRKIVHELYVEAGLITQLDGRMYDLRGHSLRKYFKTQLTALGVQADYIEYMMGHKTNTYNDIQSLGINKLRNIYANANLTMGPKAQASKTDLLKQMIRALEMSTAQAREALADGATTHRNAEDAENYQLAVLRNQLRLLIRQEASV